MTADYRSETAFSFLTKKPSCTVHDERYLVVKCSAQSELLTVDFWPASIGEVRSPRTPEHRVRFHPALLLGENEAGMSFFLKLIKRDIYADYNITLLQQKLALLITIRYQHCRNNWPHFRTLGTGGKLKHHDYKSCKFTTLNTSRKISLILHSHGLLLWKSKLTTERKVKSLTRALLDRISLPRHFSPLQMFRRCDDLLKRPVTFCGNTMETGYFNDLQLAAHYKNNLKSISLDAISIQNANKQAAITNCKSIKFMNAVESGTNQEMQIASLWMQLRKKC